MKVEYDFQKIYQNFIEFIRHNPRCLICSIIYFCLNVWVLGGTFGSIIFVVILYLLAVFIIFTNIGEELIRIINRTRRLETSREKEYLIPLFQEVYDEAKKEYNALNSIEICIIDNMTVNAFAMGRATVAVTKGAVATFSEEELKAILGHEIGHIRYGHTTATLYLLMTNGLFSIIMVMLKFILSLLDEVISSMERSGLGSLIVVFISSIINFGYMLFGFFSELIISTEKRKNEYQVDRYSYLLGYGEDMVEALYLLEQMSLGDNRDLTQRMLAYHPRITLRIEQIELILDNEEDDNFNIAEGNE